MVAATANRFQLSLRSILALVALAAFITAEKVGFSDMVAGYAGFFGTVSLASLAAVATIEGRGAIRTFAIGALFPLAMILSSFGNFMEILNEILEPALWVTAGQLNRNAFVVGWITSIGVGAVCAGCGMFIRGDASRRGDMSENPISK